MNESTASETSSAFSDRSSSRPSGGWSKPLVIVVVLVLLGLAVWAAAPVVIDQFGGSDENEFAYLVTEPARVGPFLVTANVQGNLDSQSNAVLTSEVEGQTTIISIVPEGTLVEEGDILCVLDSAPLVDESKQQEITVTNSDASEIQAKEELEVTRQQNQSDIAAAQLALTLARLDLDKYKQGEYPKLEKEFEGNLALAKEEAVQSEETYEFTKRLVKKGYKNQNELEAARIQVEKTKLAVQKAEEELKVLQQFEQKRTIAELEANAIEFVRELERAKLKATAAEVQAEQAYLAMKKSAELEREKLEKLQAQIEKCTLRAPQAGEVVYANLPSQSRRGGGDGPAIEEGASVGERQPIINLPDVTTMKVDSRVHESLIGALRAGLPAKVRADAYPDETFRAKVASVSSVPMTGRWPNTDLREYEVEIHLTDEVERVRKLRPGLTAQIEILVDSRQNVLQVPVQSVVGVGGKYFSFVLKPDGPERRELKIGQANETDIEIIDGVAEGEQVIMNPRTHFAEDIAELATLLGAEQDEETSEGMLMEEAGPPAGPPGGRFGDGPSAGSPGAGGGNAPPGAGGERRGGGDPAQMFSRLDGNNDGQLTQDELPGGLSSRFAEMDADSDGGVSQSEVADWFAKNRPVRGGPGGDGPPGRAPGGRPGGRPNAGGE